MELFYNKDFPELIETKYNPGDDIMNRMVQTVLSQKDTGNYYGGYTYKITDEHGDFKKLYDHFFNIVETVFDKPLLAPKHRSWCWANVYNKASFRTNMHTHTNTSSINCVYYLKIPQDAMLNEAGLALEKDGEFFGIYQPEEGDMIIMPSYVPHAPQFHSSDEYRIAINMEIAIKQDFQSYYTRERIYEHAKPV